MCDLHYIIYTKFLYNLLYSYVIYYELELFVYMTCLTRDEHRFEQRPLILKSRGGDGREEKVKALDVVENRAVKRAGM